MTRSDGVRALALVTDAYGGTGGIAQYSRDLIEAVASYGKGTSVVVVPRVIAREIQSPPSNVRHVTSASGSKIRFAATALREAIAHPVDLVICGHVHLLPVAWAAARARGARLILVTYGLEVWDDRGTIDRFLVASATSVISISDFTLERMRSWSRIAEDRTFILPNAVDLELYTPGPPSEAMRERLQLGEGPIILTLGRMAADEQAKGFDEILEVLGELTDEFPGLQYCAAGDGTDRARLEEKAAALGLGDAVKFPGYIDESDKPDLYRLCTVFAMPSRLEGFGYVFLEALACGIPVVASSIDGSREAVMNGGLGIMVDPRNRPQLLDGLRSALRSPFVPSRDALEYFSPGSFEQRAHRIVDATLEMSRHV
ncbi:MAG: glycosyltransferase family 4 protein [Gemmatimonadales bacterium]